MSKLRNRLRTAVLLAAATLLAVQSVWAEPAPPPMAPSPVTPPPAVPCEVELPQREIFVPLVDLSAILLADVERVFVTRGEYEALEAKVRAAARPAESTQPAAVLSAQYSASIEENRARLLGTIVVSAPDEALSAVELDLAGVAVRSAVLDGRPAALGRNAAGVPVLFVSGTGRHELKLEILAAVETAAAERTWSFQIPTPPATRLRLTVPGHVEIKSGATVIRRETDEKQQVTEFDLLPRRGPNTLVLSLNNRQLQKERVVLARAVAVDEITAAYERLHVTASLSVLHGAADRFRFAVPEGFEVTSVSAPEVARWAVSAEPAEKNAEPQANPGRVLEVFLREPATGTVVLHISAARWPVPLANWRVPKLTALEVAGEATVVGILLENRLRPSDFRPENLISIDANVLTQALPPSVLEDQAGAPALVPVAAFYAPRSDYDLQARFAAPEAELRVTTNVLLTLTEEKLAAHGGFALLGITDKLVEFDFLAPTGWQVTEVKPAGSTPLSLQTYPAADGGTRVHVRMAHAIPAGQSQSVYFRAISSPEGWLDDWSTQAVKFPVFQVVGATHDVGAIAVQVHDDMIVRADQAQRLTPLDANEKGKYGLEDVATQLAFRYETPPYALSLAATRVQPRLTARTFSFFRVEPEVLAAHYEIAYDVTEARTGRVAFELPSTTPMELSIVGLESLPIKESTSELSGAVRRWTVVLGESRRGGIRIAVDFQQPLAGPPTGGATPTKLALPLVRARDVTYQSGMVAVEGSADRDVQVVTSLRKVDVGELADADYQPGRRLLGAFGYGGETAEIQLLVTRPAEYELPTAIVERAELLTTVSASGQSQTAARFRLRAKALAVEVQLPAGSTLWAAFLDAQPTLPQRESGSLLIALPAGAEARPRDLQLVYETPIDRFGGLGSVDLTAPKLLLRGDAHAKGSVEVPLADLVWKLSTPLGLEIVRSGGTVFNGEIAVRQSPLAGVGTALSSVLSTRQAAREAARRVKSAAPAYRPDNARSEEKTAVQDEPMVEHFQLGDDSKADAEMQEAGDAFAAPSDMDIGAADEVFDSGELELEARGNMKGQLARRAGPPASKPAPAENGAGGGMGGFGGKVAAPVAAPARVAPESQWALEGLRSLPIDLQSDWKETAFQSLGTDPRLAVTVVDRARLKLLSWAVGLSVLLRGVWLTAQSRRERVRFVCLTLLVAFVLPLALPLGGLVGPLCNMAFYAACLLIIYYPLAAMFRWFYANLRGVTYPLATERPITTKAITTALLMLLLHSASQADEPVVPVKVPVDAIIVPYDPQEHDPLAAPGKPFATDRAQKILVPYGKYLELLRAAQETGKPRPAAPADYVLAGGRFTATLDGGQSLLVEGYLDVDVLVDHPVSVPLGLVGGVLTQVTLAAAPDKPLQPQPAVGGAAADRAKQPAAQPAAPAPPEPALTIVVSGPGRQRLQLAMRFRIQSRGGWQTVEGRLPAPLAAALTLTVSKAETEVVLTGGVDRGTIETKRDGETIETALPADAAFHVEWRPKTGPAPVDQSLAAHGTVLLDVQESGLRLLWRFDLALRGGQRESFSIDVPADYLVEKVTGGNVRGWRLAKAEGKQRLEVTLLKAAQGSESFWVALSRLGAVGSGDLAEFSAPVLSVVGAAQQSGELTIRRSPLLQLRTEQSVGVQRADGNAPQVDPNVDAEESPLGILPYQFYRFATTPFTIKLSARPMAPRVTAQLQTVLKISQRQRTLESRVRLRVDERPIYRLRIALPDDWKLDRVTAPQPFQWVIGQEGPRRVLNLYFAGGQRQSLDVVLAGVLGSYGAIDSLNVPKLEVLAADEEPDPIVQTGHIVVEADPSLGVRAEKLAGCETELLSAVGDWLAPAQQQLARLALHYRTPDFSAQLQLSERKPVVHVNTVSNIRVTERSVEETILLDFTIQEAGIRSLSFLLPANLSDARISAPMLRQKTITPLDDKTGRVRVRLELQEEVISNLRVLVEDDRLLTDEKYVAPIPQVETGQTEHRYVTLESAGRDEIVVSQHEGLQAVSSEQAEWRMLSAMLGRGLTQAYAVNFGAPRPRLALRAQDRKAVETAGARIGLAKATLVVDAGGAFRGEQLYRVDNSLEQYLVVHLPAGADLWTAHVAGDPVKPAADKTPGSVRIPLVKTAPGDADYPVVLKYGGQLPRLGALARVEFPLMRTENIHVELSQVELYAPESYDWFDFGGTMRLVEGEGYLAADLLKYNTRQIGLAIESLHSEDSYARTRAANNLKSLQAEAAQLKQSAGSYGYNDELTQQLESNTKIQRGLDIELNQPVQAGGETDQRDNRSRLGELFRSQAGSRANEVVNQSGANFEAETVTKAEAAPAEAQGQQLNPQWLAKNRLDSADAKGGAAGEAGEITELGASTASKKRKVPQATAAPAPQTVAQTPGRQIAPQQPVQPAAPALAEPRSPQSMDVIKERESTGKKAQSQVQRYAERLAKQQQAQADKDVSGQPVEGTIDARQPMGAMTGSPAKADGQYFLSGGELPAGASNLQQAGPALPPAALASLDVNLNPRGKKFLFTTPRGDVEVTARAVSEPLMSRLIRLAAVAILLGLVVAAIRRRRWIAAASGTAPARTLG